MTFLGPADFFATAGSDAVFSVDAQVLEYSTMRGRDIAIVRLDSTLGELEGLGIAPVPIKDLPATYCLYGMDDAGNATPVKEIDIPRG